MKRENQFASMSKDEIADRVFFKKHNLSFEEVHKFNWKTWTLCRNYVKTRFESQISKAGLTRRANKLWNSASVALFVRDHVEVEDSVWSVNWLIHKALEKDIFPFLHVQKNKSYIHSSQILENSEIFEILGYVSAPDLKSAIMMAKVTLGPRAHHDEFLSFRRIDIGGWERAKLLNKLLEEKYKNYLDSCEMSMERKKWELEQVACQISFLSSTESPISNS